MTVVIHQASQLIPATQSEWASENELELVLAGEVSLLQGPADHRLKLVARQVSLRDAGTLDLLCVDENGLPVAVEVKLARNGESRRAVVAQIVDYLSALTELTVDELDVVVEGALEEALKSFDVPENRENFERRWQAVGANLRGGLARIVVAMDQSRPDLTRIVQFLSERSNLDIRLLTVSKFEEARIGALYVPIVVVANEGQPSPRPSARPAVRDPSLFIERWKEAVGPTGAEAADAWFTFVEAARRAGIANLDVGHFDAGGPYIYVSTTPVGPVELFRLVDRKPLIRDQLHKAPERIWDPNPTAAAARDEFRRVLLERVPGARVGGGVGRVEGSVNTFAEQSTVVLGALSHLVSEIQGLRPRESAPANGGA